jgi:hypothetical protein
MHHLFDDGSFAVAVRADCAAQICRADGAQAALELVDYAQFRSLVWIGGRLGLIPLPAVRGLLDPIAAADPNPALLQVQTPG